MTILISAVEVVNKCNGSSNDINNPYSNYVFLIKSKTGIFKYSV